MNQWLAEIYGTNGADADDFEKTAQAHLLSKLAEENKLDLSQFSPEELQQLLTEVMGEQVMAQGQEAGPQINAQSPQSQGLPPGTDMNPTQMGQQPQQRPGQHPMMQQAFAPAAQPQVPQGMPAGAMQQPSAGDTASLQKEAQAKFEEADLLGRVMAHAYTQELEKIAMTKTAGKLDAAKDAVKGVAGKAANFGKNNKKAIGAAAGGAAAGFAAGRMSKKASAGPAFQKLAEMHAADILGAAGFDPATGTDTWAQQAQSEQQVQGQAPQGQEGQQQEEQQAGGEDFGQAIDNAALQLLEGAGYDTQEILARLALARQNQNGQA